MPELLLDEATHTYTVEGREVISVTQALDRCGLLWRSEDEGPRERGRRVHEACHYFDEQDLDWSTVLAEDEPYVRAWESCRKQFHLEILAVEKKLYDPLRHYAGKPDVVGKVDGLNAVLDRKAGQVQAAAALQVAGYGNLAWPGSVVWRAAVQLKPDGKFSLHIYPMEEYLSDLHDFYSCLRVAAWKERNGK